MNFCVVWHELEVVICGVHLSFDSCKKNMIAETICMTNDGFSTCNPIFFAFFVPLVFVVSCCRCTLLSLSSLLGISN